MKTSFLEKLKGVFLLSEVNSNENGASDVLMLYRIEDSSRRFLFQHFLKYELNCLDLNEYCLIDLNEIGYSMDMLAECVASKIESENDCVFIVSLGKYYLQ